MNLYTFELHDTSRLDTKNVERGPDEKPYVVLVADDLGSAYDAFRHDWGLSERDVRSIRLFGHYHIPDPYQTVGTAD